MENSRNVKVLHKGQEEMKTELQTVKMTVIENSRNVKVFQGSQEGTNQKLNAIASDHEQRIRNFEAAS